MADLDPLSFAALAASGPLWVKDKLPSDVRRCSYCQKPKKLTNFNRGSTVCQQCVATNKVRRVQEAKQKYAAKKRQQEVERAMEARNANVDG